MPNTGNSLQSTQAVNKSCCQTQPTPADTPNPPKRSILSICARKHSSKTKNPPTVRTHTTRCPTEAKNKPGCSSRYRLGEILLKYHFVNSGKHAGRDETASHWRWVGERRFPSSAPQKTTQVRNTCNYRTDGERGDMPGKEELPILRLDAPVHRPLIARSLYLLCAFDLLFLLLLFVAASSLRLHSVLRSMPRPPAELRQQTGDALPAPECRGAPTHVLAWPLNKLMFYGCTAPPTHSLKGPAPPPSCLWSARQRYTHWIWKDVLTCVCGNPVSDSGPVCGPDTCLCSRAEEATDQRLEKVSAAVSLTASADKLMDSEEQ